MMTAKERRDAQLELRDMARRDEEYDLHNPTPLSQCRERARFLRAVADELDRVPEEQ